MSKLTLHCQMIYYLIYNVKIKFTLSKNDFDFYFQNLHDVVTEYAYS